MFNILSDDLPGAVIVPTSISSVVRSRSAVAVRWLVCWPDPRMGFSTEESSICFGSFAGSVSTTLMKTFVICIFTDCSCCSFFALSTDAGRSPSLLTIVFVMVGTEAWDIEEFSVSVFSLALLSSISSSESSITITESFSFFTMTFGTAFLDVFLTAVFVFAIVTADVLGWGRIVRLRKTLGLDRVIAVFAARFGRFDGDFDVVSNDVASDDEEMDSKYFSTFIWSKTTEHFSILAGESLFDIWFASATSLFTRESDEEKRKHKNLHPTFDSRS